MDSSIEQKEKPKYKRCPKGTRINKSTGRCEPNKKTRATKKIGHFVLKNRKQLRTHFLKTICADSGQCIALGTEATKIRQFFDGFSNFTFLTTVRKIGKSSANGSIYELRYEHRGYVSYAILKLNAVSGADSLLYEAFVGKKINEYAKKYPCFLETYGDFTVPMELWQKIRARKNASMKKKDVEELSLGLTDKEASCRYSYYKTQAILIQHIKVSSGEESLKDCIQSKKFVRTNLANVLYQVYAVLSVLSDEYTHYDLHSENVMTIVFKPRQYIEYHYQQLDGSVLSFKSKYMAKIIDYGRNYIRESSSNFRDSLCAIKKCNQPRAKCGANYGYGWLDPSPNEFFVNSTVRNKSHDLRLVADILETGISNKCLEQILRQIVFTDDYGTAELEMSGLSEGKINNVCDMAETLRHYIQLPNPDVESFYLSYTKMGDIYVDLRGHHPVRYVPV
jgi:hypothetical protein